MALRGTRFYPIAYLFHDGEFYYYSAYCCDDEDPHWAVIVANAPIDPALLGCPPTKSTEHADSSCEALCVADSTQPSTHTIGRLEVRGFAGSMDPPDDVIHKMHVCPISVLADKLIVNGNEQFSFDFPMDNPPATAVKLQKRKYRIHSVKVHYYLPGANGAWNQVRLEFLLAHHCMARPVSASADGVELVQCDDARHDPLFSGRACEVALSAPLAGHMIVWVMNKIR